MKRLLTIGLMLAAALALTNCVDQFETPIQENDIIVDETTTLQGEGEPFEVFVETAVSSGLDQNLADTLKNDRKYKIRFFILDWIGSIENFFCFS